MKSRETWAFMSGPIALTFAVATVGMIGFLLAHTKNVWEIKISWSIVTVGLVLDIKQTERMLVEGASQAAGTVLGAIAGVGIAAIYASLVDDEPNTASLWLWVAVTLAAFIGATLMKFAGENAYIFHLSMMTVTIVAYSSGILVAVGRFISVITGIVIAIGSLLIFTREKTHSAVLRYYETVVSNCLSLATFAFTTTEGQPDEILERVRGSLFSAEDTLDARRKWRGWFRLSKEVEIDHLAESVIKLYHQSHNCYITSRAVDFTSLLEDHDMRLHFTPLIEKACATLADLALEVPRIHNIKQANTETFTAKVEELSTVVVKINQIYLLHRGGFLKAKSLRWHVNSMSVSLAMLSIALAQYYINACAVPTESPIDADLHMSMTCRLELVQSQLRGFLKSGPASTQMEELA